MDGAPRRSGPWLVALPAMLLGSQAAHDLAYRLAYPDVGGRVHVLAVSGHVYLSELPLVLGVAAAIATCTLICTTIDAVRGKGTRPIPPVAFAVLPPLAFTLQEFTERWFVAGGFPWWMIEQPTFRIGLLLQVPFALAAFVVTRFLLRTARTLGRLLADSRPARRVSAPLRLRVRATSVSCASRFWSASIAPRGPPEFGC